jgi:hypothetical protein
MITLGSSMSIDTDAQVRPWAYAHSMESESAAELASSTSWPTMELYGY